MATAEARGWTMVKGQKVLLRERKEQADVSFSQYQFLRRGKWGGTDEQMLKPNRR